MKSPVVKVKKKNGRPTTYTKEIARKICEEIGSGKSLRKVLLADDMPAMSSVFLWLQNVEGFSEQYRIATEQRTETQNEMLVDMGDEAIAHAEDCDPKAAGAIVSAYKLKADNFKWAMSKTKPKKYGEKMDVTSDGEALKGNTIIFSEFKKPDATDSK